MQSSLLGAIRTVSGESTSRVSNTGLPEHYSNLQLFSGDRTQLGVISVQSVSLNGFLSHEILQPLPVIIYLFFFFFFPLYCDAPQRVQYPFHKETKSHSHGI